CGHRLTQGCQIMAVLVLALAAAGSPARAAEVAPATRPSPRRYIVTGKVLDGLGRPMRDVAVRAHCGYGTLHISGETTTGIDGKYRLSFGPGVRLDGADGHIVGFQAATISPLKEG